MKYFYLLLICFSSGPGYSQLFVGYKYGFSVPAMEGIPGNHDSYLSGFRMQGGLAINAKINDEMSFQCELNFLPKGGHRVSIDLIPEELYQRLGLSDKRNLYVNCRHTIVLNYIETPLMLKYTMGQKFRYSFCFGPSLGILVRARDYKKGIGYVYTDEQGTQLLMKDALHPYNVSFDFNKTTTGEYHHIEIGFQGGFGCEYPVGNFLFFSEVRTSIGINNVRIQRQSSGKLYTGLLGIAAGCMVKIK